MSRQGSVLRNEHGGVATLVAMFFAFGVILGMASLSIDVGKMMFERRELQNGADAAVLSLAQSCAKGAATCAAGAEGTFSALSAGNAKDEKHAIERQCGVNTGGSLIPCTDPGDLADLTECPPIPTGTPGKLKYVEVRTQTQASDGGPITNFFARANDGTGQSSLLACARAAFGPPGGAAVLPLTFSMCEYKDVIKPSGVGYGVETSLPLKYGKDTTPCDASTAPSGGDFAGGFGFLDHTDCVSNVDAESWVEASTGVGKANECLPDIDPGTTIYIPIFDCISASKTLCVPGHPTGTKTNYHIDGFAAFYVTAYDVTGTAKAHLPGYPGTAANDECKDESKDNKCIWGWFLDDYVSGTGTIDPEGTDYGAVVVLPMG